MKRIVRLLIVSCCSSLSVMAQMEICLSTDKTTSLIFPLPIKHVDRGAQSVLAQQVKEAPAVLLVKAGAKGFAETNLSVITEDGSLYSFRVCYDEHPTVWVHQLPLLKKASAELNAYAIMDNPAIVHSIHDNHGGVKAEIKGVYIGDSLIYLHFALANKSVIDYDVDLLRFYIAGRKKMKRTAVQEIELTPVYIVGNTKKIKAKMTSVAVVVLAKFTIPDAKFLRIQIMEKSGGRQLNLKLINRWLMKAKPISEYKDF